MTERDQSGDVPLTEREPVPCLFVTGTVIEVTRHIVRLIGWVHLPQLGGEMDERRIVVRFVMPVDVADHLRDELGNGLGHSAASVRGSGQRSERN